MQAVAAAHAFDVQGEVLHGFLPKDWMPEG
jgi:hypothetical protein